LKEGAELVGGQGLHLLVLHLWQGATLRWIFYDEVLLDAITLIFFKNNH